MDGGAWWAAVHGVAVRHDWATSLSLSFLSFFFENCSLSPVLWKCMKFPELEQRSWGEVMPPLLMRSPVQSQEWPRGPLSPLGVTGRGERGGSWGSAAFLSTERLCFRSGVWVPPGHTSMALGHNCPRSVLILVLRMRAVHTALL